MDKSLENITLETLSDAVRKAGIQPGEKFTILRGERPSFAKIAAKMRATAIARGMTNEIFDQIMSEPL